jgi:hypothetical protein
MNDVLRNDRFEAGKVIEKEYLAGVDLTVGVVNLDVDSQMIVNERKSADTPLVHAFVDLKSRRNNHQNAFG